MIAARPGAPGPDILAPVFLAPLRLEALAVRRGAPGVRVERIGMGPDRATSARVRLSRLLPAGQPVVLFGVAGALECGLKPGDVVVASELGSLGSDETTELPDAADVAQVLRRALTSRTTTVHVAPVVCSAKVIHGDAERQKAAARGAVAVDMESLWCAPLGRGRPFAVVRTILDVPGRELVSWRTLPGAASALSSLARAARALRGWDPGSVDRHPPLEVD